MKFHLTFNTPINVSLETDDNGNITGYQVSEYFKVRLAQHMTTDGFKGLLEQVTQRGIEEGFSIAEINFKDDFTVNLAECDNRIWQMEAPEERH